MNVTKISNQRYIVEVSSQIVIVSLNESDGREVRDLLISQQNSVATYFDVETNIFILSPMPLNH